MPVLHRWLPQARCFVPAVPWPWVGAGFAVPEGNTMNMDWQADSICPEVGIDVYFPNPKDILLKRYIARVCADCPVRALCAAFALAEGIRDGIWGGVDAGHYRSRQLLADVAGGL